MSGLASAARKVAAGVVAVAAFFGAVVGTGIGEPTDVHVPAHVGDPAHLVVLGDSYSAGEGLSPYLAGTQDAPDGNRCHRSLHAYGAVLGSSIASPAHFEACSGAVIADILPMPPEHAGQVAAPDPTASVVTITISGNDALFSTIVGFCLAKLHCLDNKAWHITNRTEPDLQTYAAHRLPEIDTELGPFYDKLHKQFPNARIVVLGYPRLFSLHPSSSASRYCSSAYALFSDTERVGLRDLGNSFNAIVARRAIGAGLEYVEVADAFEGHETCGSAGPWLSFLRFGLLHELDSYAKTGGVDPGTFHPTEDGQAMMARLVACYLAAHPSNPYTGLPAAASARVKDATGKVVVGLAGDAVHACATQHLDQAPDLAAFGP
jgi:hypothetical protein